MAVNTNAPWWKTEGLVVAGGWHPLPGRIRQRIQPEDVEQDYFWEYTEDHILRLKSLGITLLIGQFHRGLGESDETQHQELARRQAELCHKHGIRHGVYLPNTIYYESMLKDAPECEDWVVHCHDGSKCYYGGEQTWRWAVCFNAPGWRKHLKRQIDIAINDVKTDLLHFDNLGQPLAPLNCCCQYCRRFFSDYLLKRYPTAKAQERRFGFAGIGHVRIPDLKSQPFWQPWDLERIQNPVLQEWLEFRTDTLTDYINEMAAHARSIKPDIAIDSNGQAVHGNNDGLCYGRGDKEAQVEHVDILWDENHDYRPDDDPRSIIPSTRAFRGMLFARRLDKEVICPYRNEAELAFNLTIASNPGINHHWGYAEPGRKPLNDHQEGVKPLLEMFMHKRFLYRKLAPANRIGLWRERKSLMYVSTETHLSACVMEQLLFNRRIPFSIIHDRFIDQDRLKDFDLLILPNVEFVSDAQLMTLLDFVKKGGRLLITERSGMYTGEPRIRKASAFAPLFANDGNIPGRVPRKPDPSSGMYGAERGALFGGYGSGRAVHLPHIHYVHPPKTFNSRYNVHYDGIDSRYWKEPFNACEIIDALEWLYAGLYPVKVYGAPELRLEHLCDAEGWRVVPIVRCGSLGGPCDIPLSIRAGSIPSESEFHTPERQVPLSLEWLKEGDRCHAILPNVQRHAVLRYRR